MNFNGIIQHPFTKVLVYANVFIAICAFAQVFLTHFLFHLPYTFDNISYLVFVPLATFVQYNMQRGYMIAQQNLGSERSQWLHKNRRWMLYINFAGLIGLIFLCNSLSWTSIIIMVGAEVVSSLYYLPPFNLRKYGYIKPFLISAVWTISCTLVPLIENKLLSPDHTHYYYFVMAQFLFISELCMVFDIKDAGDDFIGGVYTYANVWGVKSTKIVCALLLISSVMCFYLFKASNTSLLLYALSILITLVVSLLSSDKKHSFYFYLIIDGMLIVQTMLILLR